MRFTTDENDRFLSRRSPVIAPGAAVASSQPLATEAGLRILHAGGTAADAAVAVAAALQVTQPCSTGLGGDAFFLYYQAATGEVTAYNGSGRSPAALTLERAREAAVDGALPDYHAHTVTVPGAADVWVALHDRHGALPLPTTLEPAIRLAADGFAPGPMAARWWASGAERQLAGRRYGSELTVDGRAPRCGERFRNPGLARVLETLASNGRAPFYTGWIAERIVAEVRHEGGVLSLEDLATHSGEWVAPIGIEYGGYQIWECPPNGQGLAALLALACYAAWREDAGSADAENLLHARVESMRLGFADAAEWVADPASDPAPLHELLGTPYARRRARLIRSDRRIEEVGPGLPRRTAGDDTVYFCTVDADGNGCSFINSNFMGFGTGIVPRGCGFTLQNRGRGFLLEPGRANTLAPGKRPYHTIIPGMMTRSGEFAAVFGVMGGMMQPQGHLQVVASLVDDGVDPQTALDRPRFQLAGGDPDGALLVEESLDASLRSGLERRGHRLTVVSGADRAGFGLGQVIARGDDGVLWCGSDPRGDGCAAGM